MKAEAFNELEQVDQPSAISTKLGKEPETVLTHSSTDLLPECNITQKEDLRKAIFHERRVELAMEFHRYFDLMRWGHSGRGKSWEKDLTTIIVVTNHPQND